MLTNDPVSASPETDSQPISGPEIVTSSTNNTSSSVNPVFTIADLHPATGTVDASHAGLPVTTVAKNAVAKKEDLTKQVRDSHNTPISMFLSTLLSLAVVVVLLITIRWVLPPLLESSRYSWYRGQLRAQHEAAGVELKQVSLDGLSRISELVSKRVTPSVVHINIKRKASRDSLEELLQDADPTITDRLRQGQGSGVIVDADGFLITNYHVLEDGEIIEVRMSDDARHTARMVGFDRDRDLAVLKIEKTDLPPMDWGNSDDVAVGSPVWAIGSPFGLTGSITFGILSSKHRIDLSDSKYQLSSGVSTDYSDLMQSDVAINPGNSGGPLVNGRGELIGINTAILGPTYRGVSFSIPSNLVRVVYDSIILKSKTTTGWLGVMLRDGSGAAEVQEFAKPGPSPARDAGLEIGDAILKFDNKPVLGYRQLIEMIGTKKVGETISMDIKRGDQKMKIAVELGPRPVMNSPNQ